MSAGAQAAFSRSGVFALVVGGFGLFIGLLWLIGAGADFGGDRGRGQAHAAATGLNGYAGLVQLVEAAGYEVERSRSVQALKTDGLLVIAPPATSDAEDIAAILKDRTFRGPTLVILSKWWATPPPDQLPPETRSKFKRGWVMLSNVTASDWTAALPAPFAFSHRLAGTGPQGGSDWRGMGRSGRMPTRYMLHAVPKHAHEPLITDRAGRVLAFEATPTLRRAVRAGSGGNSDDIDDDDRAYPVIFLAEPDIANNYGLADPDRAAAAVALVERLAGAGDIDRVTFDMTLNGFGASENLLTLAFRPPFLAATLSLLAALLIVGWRAFQRFGPPAVPAGPDIAFGKRQLIANGAGLIVRARRFALLGAPYAALSGRRLAERLGLARADGEAIDAALARRLPGEEPFTRRAARLEAADKPADILAAAQSLDALTTKLSQGPT